MPGIYWLQCMEKCAILQPDGNAAKLLGPILLSWACDFPGGLNRIARDVI